MAKNCNYIKLKNCCTIIGVCTRLYPMLQKNLMTSFFVRRINMENTDCRFFLTCKTFRFLIILLNIHIVQNCAKNVDRFSSIPLSLRDISVPFISYCTQCTVSFDINLQLAEIALSDDD